MRLCLEMQRGIRAIQVKLISPAAGRLLTDCRRAKSAIQINVSRSVVAALSAEPGSTRCVQRQSLRLTGKSCCGLASDTGKHARLTVLRRLLPWVGASSVDMLAELT